MIAPSAKGWLTGSTASGIPATSLTVSWSSAFASNASPNCVAQQLLPATCIRRKGREGSVPRMSRSFSAATGVISIISSPLRISVADTMVADRSARDDPPRLRQVLEPVGLLVPAVQQRRLRLSAAHRLDLVDGRDHPAIWVLHVCAERADVDDELELFRIFVRHAVVAGDLSHRLLHARRMEGGRQRNAVTDGLEDLPDRRSPDVPVLHHLGDLGHHDVSALTRGQ